jgi:hypothetical protein
MIKDWKKLFIKDVREKFEVALDEFNDYEEKKDLIYLQQAGNKMFSAVENILMLKYGQITGGYKPLLNIVKNNKDDVELLIQAMILHKFFYNSDLFMDKLTIEKTFIIVKNKMEYRIKYIEGLM